MVFVLLLAVLRSIDFIFSYFHKFVDYIFAVADSSDPDRGYFCISAFILKNCLKFLIDAEKRLSYSVKRWNPKVFQISKVPNSIFIVVKTFEFSI